MENYQIEIQIQEILSSGKANVVLHRVYVDHQTLMTTLAILDALEHKKSTTIRNAQDKAKSWQAG